MKGYSTKAWDKCTIRVRPNFVDLQRVRCFVQKEIFSFTRSARSLLFTQITSFCHLKVLIFVWAFTHWPCFVWVREEPSKRHGTVILILPRTLKRDSLRIATTRSFWTRTSNAREKRMDGEQKSQKIIQICNVSSERGKMLTRFHTLPWNKQDWINQY